LTAHGRSEAVAIADLLLGVVPPGARVVSSPARRALETAGPIAERLGASVTIDPDLREVDVGTAEGLTWEEVERRLPDVAAALAAGRRVDWPDGEVAEALDARVRAVWSRLARRGGAVVVVSHAGVIASFLAGLAPESPPRWIGPASAVALGRRSGVWLADLVTPDL
jgi:probable phosphoglycerate mutase